VRGHPLIVRSFGTRKEGRIEDEFREGDPLPGLRRGSVWSILTHAPWYVHSL
jgi:hypothetical protein